MTIAVVVRDRRGRPEVIVRWSSGRRNIVVPDVTPENAAAFAFKVERQIRRALRGRAPSVEAEVAALLSIYPASARAYGLPGASDPRTVPAGPESASAARQSER